MLNWGNRGCRPWWRHQAVEGAQAAGTRVYFYIIQELGPRVPQSNTIISPIGFSSSSKICLHPVVTGFARVRRTTISVLRSLSCTSEPPLHNPKAFFFVVQQNHQSFLPTVSVDSQTTRSCASSPSCPCSSRHSCCSSRRIPLRPNSTMRCNTDKTCL